MTINNKSTQILTDETLITTDGLISYLIKNDSNHITIQKIHIDSKKTQTITLQYAQLEILQSLNKNRSVKDAYIDYLSQHYILGSTKYTNYQGYRYFVQFIKPFMFDKITSDTLECQEPYNPDPDTTYGKLDDSDDEYYLDLKLKYKGTS